MSWLEPYEPYDTTAMNTQGSKLMYNVEQVGLCYNLFVKGHELCLILCLYYKKCQVFASFWFLL